MKPKDMLKSFFQGIKKPLLTIIILSLFLTFIPFEVMITNNLNPLIFGIAFFLANRQMINYNIVIGLLLTITASYVAFFAGLLSFFGLASLIELITNENIEPEIYIIISGLIACLTLYLIFTKIYKTVQIKKGIIIIISSYLLVPFVVVIFPLLFQKTLRSEFFMLYNLVWLLVVGFFLTLTINLNESKIYAV